MSLLSTYAAVLASCTAVPQHDVYASEIGSYQFKAAYGVNKYFWRAWDDLTLRIDAPSPPAQIYFRFYETLNYQIGDVPLITVGGYLATCATPGMFKGTSAWLWMAILGVQSFGSFNYPVTWAHIQYKNTNAGSIGLVMYPTTPP
jgi:hypothetical protein